MSPQKNRNSEVSHIGGRLDHLSIEKAELDFNKYIFNPEDRPVRRLATPERIFDKVLLKERQLVLLANKLDRVSVGVLIASKTVPISTTGNVAIFCEDLLVYDPLGNKDHTDAPLIVKCSNTSLAFELSSIEDTLVIGDTAVTDMLIELRDRNEPSFLHKRAKLEDYTLPPIEKLVVLAIDISNENFLRNIGEDS